mmetsp:Transcript_10277/g.23737  ORF Transcript_10277/g.23737 Transcript_10277/m.23737 type:complete len:528 (+) Transcript_10277:2200-3783(+)
MAGDKLSARQKMIGMMYLVLTALLALQVSSSILEKFIFINQSLQQSVDIKVKENKRTLERLQTTVREMGNREHDVKILNAALDVRKQTKYVIGYIGDLKAKLVALTGGENEETGYPKGLKNDSVVARLMINHAKGHELKKLLNDYMYYLTQTTGKKYASIALDAKDIDLFRNDPNQVHKDFTTLNFEKTPLGAALATLSQFSSEVVHAETKALAELARRIGDEDVRFDNLTPLVKPQSNIVAAGTKYKADLFLAASSSGIDPEMAINGTAIPVNEGVGKIEFRASPGDYNEEGLAKKTFQATIKLNLPGNKVSTLGGDITYFVAKPIVQIQSAAVQALYLNCGNELNIQVPSLGTEYNPRFTATGADVVVGNRKGFVTVIPKAAEVKLHVYSNDHLLDTQVFRVRKIPKPEICITSQGRTVNERQGMPVPGPRSLEARVVADESFKTFLPNDARYRVAAWEISLARGSRAIKTKRVNRQDVRLNDFASLARAGDRLVIEIKKVERLNFRGAVEAVRVGTIVHTIPLT